MIEFKDTPYTRALYLLMVQLDNAVDEPITGLLTGAMAAHLYTGDYPVSNVDIQLSEDIYLYDSDKTVIVRRHINQPLQSLQLHHENPFPDQRLIHQNYKKDSIDISWDFLHLNLKVLNPVDLAIYHSNDTNMVKSLTECGLITKQAIEHRLKEIVVNQDDEEVNLESDNHLYQLIEANQPLLALP